MFASVFSRKTEYSTVHHFKLPFLVNLVPIPVLGSFRWEEDAEVLSKLLYPWHLGLLSWGWDWRKPWSLPGPPAGYWVDYISYIYNKTNGAIRRHFGKQMNKVTNLRIHNITAKAAVKVGSEAWVLEKREEQRLEAAQMKFLKHLLAITKLD